MDTTDKINLIIFSAVIIFFIVMIIIAKKNIKTYKRSIKQNYDAFISNKKISKWGQNALVDYLSQDDEKNKKLTKLFDNARNPWGITPGIFRAMRITGLSVGIILAIICYITFDASYSVFGILIAALSWFYPMYYYKSVAKEREEEWDKIYEYIWVIKHTTMLYDAKKSCMEIGKYIANHCEYKEIVRGFKEFYEYWYPKEKSEFITRFYNFSIPKEIFNILFQMEASGHVPEDELDNLRTFAVNKQSAKAKVTLSKVVQYATLFSLPFLMASLIIAIIIPMIFDVMRMM